MTHLDAARAACAATFDLPMETHILADLHAPGGDRIAGYAGTLEALFTDAVAAAAPLIEAQVREQVARDLEAEADRIDPPGQDWPDAMSDAAVAGGLRTGARIAREGVR